MPRTSTELADLVRILLKTSDSQRQDHTALLKSCVYQARIRRAVVVKLIFYAKARGHPSYQLLEEDVERTRAANLPEDGVPPELFAVFENDDSIDKLRPQKAATPVDGRTRPEQAFNDLRPHGVVQERSGADVADTSEQRIYALQATVSELHGEDAGGPTLLPTAEWSAAQVAEWIRTQVSPQIWDICCGRTSTDRFY